MSLLKISLLTLNLYPPVFVSPTVEKRLWFVILFLVLIILFTSIRSLPQLGYPMVLIKGITNSVREA